MKGVNHATNEVVNIII